MLSEKIICAWKDVDYRLSLSEAERARLPEHPAGLVELTEKELQPAGGALSAGCSIQTCNAFCLNHLTKNTWCGCVQ